MERMTKEECMQFLRSPVRTGKLATVRKDGQPLVVPVWYDLEGDTAFRGRLFTPPKGALSSLQVLSCAFHFGPSAQE